MNGAQNCPLQNNENKICNHHRHHRHQLLLYCCCCCYLRCAHCCQYNFLQNSLSFFIQIRRPSKRTAQMAPTLNKNHVKDGNIKSNNYQGLPSSRDRHTINRRLLRRTLLQYRNHNRTKVETPSLPAAPPVVYTPIRVSDYDASTNALAIGEKNSLRIIIRGHSDQKGILFEVRE